VRHFDGGRDQRGLAELGLRLRLEPQKGVTDAAAEAVRELALRGVERILNAPRHTVGATSYDSLSTSSITPGLPMPPFGCISAKEPTTFASGTYGQAVWRGTNRLSRRSCTRRSAHMKSSIVSAYLMNIGDTYIDGEIMWSSLQSFAVVGDS
jgi:hypothetical protein